MHTFGQPVATCFNVGWCWIQFGKGHIFSCNILQHFLMVLYLFGHVRAKDPCIIIFVPRALRFFWCNTVAPKHVLSKAPSSMLQYGGQTCPTCCACVECCVRLASSFTASHNMIQRCCNMLRPFGRDLTFEVPRTTSIDVTVWYAVNMYV